MEGLASSSARPAAALRDLLVANAVLLNVDLACGTEAPIWREPAHWLEAHLLQDLVRKRIAVVSGTGYADLIRASPDLPVWSTSPPKISTELQDTLPSNSSPEAEP